MSDDATTKKMRGSVRWSPTMNPVSGWHCLHNTHKESSTNPALKAIVKSLVTKEKLKCTKSARGSCAWHLHLMQRCVMETKCKLTDALHGQGKLENFHRFPARIIQSNLTCSQSPLDGVDADGR